MQWRWWSGCFIFDAVHLRVAEKPMQSALDTGKDTVIAASAKILVLEPGQKSFKKKVVSITRHLLMWQKHLKDSPARLLLKE